MRAKHQSKYVVICKKTLKRLYLLDFIFGITYFYSLFVVHYRLCKMKRRWEDINEDNNTVVGNNISDGVFPIDKIKVGKGTYGPLCVRSYDVEGDGLLIGTYCSIAKGVKFILGGNHCVNHLSTYPFKAIYNGENESMTKGPIIVEDDVWIGTDALILSGCRIGRGSIIAAGSVVTKSTPPFSIVGGNPAKLIKMRFDELLIQELLKTDLSKLEEEDIRKNIEILYEPLNMDSLDKIKSIFDCGN